MYVFVALINVNLLSVSGSLLISLQIYIFSFKLRVVCSCKNIYYNSWLARYLIFLFFSSFFSTFLSISPKTSIWKVVFFNLIHAYFFIFPFSLCPLRYPTPLSLLSSRSLYLAYFLLDIYVESCTISIFILFSLIS